MKQSPQDSLDDATWDRECEAKWRRIGEEERETWRERVRLRMPELAKRPAWLEGLAKGWCFDPSKVAGMPPERNALTEPAIPAKER